MNRTQPHPKQLAPACPARSLSTPPLIMGQMPTLPWATSKPTPSNFPWAQLSPVAHPALAISLFPLHRARANMAMRLAFTCASNFILFYKAEKNVAYSPQHFRGTASFWMRLDPAEIGGQYADPFQMTDKIFSDDCIWIDFTKNDVPSDFRLGVFGDHDTWDPNNLQAAKQGVLLALGEGHRAALCQRSLDACCRHLGWLE